MGFHGHLSNGLLHHHPQRFVFCGTVHGWWPVLQDVFSPFFSTVFFSIGRFTLKKSPGFFDSFVGNHRNFAYQDSVSSLPVDQPLCHLSAWLQKFDVRTWPQKERFGWIVEREVSHFLRRNVPFENILIALIASKIWKHALILTGVIKFPILGASNNANVW